MPRFLTSKSCLWYPTSCSYCSITVLILGSHPPGQWGDHQWGKYPCPDLVSQQTWPGAPANTLHAITPTGEHPPIICSLDTIWFLCHVTTQDQRNRKNPVLVERLQGISFQIFQKKSDTQESHMAREKMLCCWSFLFQLKYSLHIYMFLNT